MSTKSNVEKLCNEGKTALENTKELPEIQACFTPLGYGPEKIDEGLNLLNTLITKKNNRIRLKNQQKEATAIVNTSFSALKKLNIRHIKISRAALEDYPEFWDRLDLGGERNSTLEGYIKQAKQFYRESIADTNIIKLLTEVGLTSETMKNGLNVITSLEQAKKTQISAKGIAQQATIDRNASYTIFKTWMKKFWKIADVALADKPQWQERLGRLIK